MESAVLKGQEAEDFLRTGHLELILDPDIQHWRRVYLCTDSGELWERTTDGRYDEIVVITRVTPEHVLSKYGHLPGADAAIRNRMKW